MNGAENILEIRFVGNEISPLTVRPIEIAELITSFEQIVLLEINERHPQFDTKQLFITFDQIKNESLGLSFAPHLIEDVIVATFSLITTSFQTGDFSDLTNQTIKELRSFTKFSKTHNCIGNFNLNGETLSSFTPATEIPYNKNPIIVGDIKIFGRVMDSGGDNPNVHLKVSDDHILIFSTSEDQAKDLAHKLYEKVSLIGRAKWDAVTYEIKEFKLKEVVDFTPGKTLDAIKELRNITSGYWDNYNSNDEINNQLLRD